MRATISVDMEGIAGMHPRRGIPVRVRGVRAAVAV